MPCQHVLRYNNIIIEGTANTNNISGKHGPIDTNKERHVMPIDVEVVFLSRKMNISEPIKRCGVQSCVLVKD